MKPNSIQPKKISSSAHSLGKIFSFPFAPHRQFRRLTFVAFILLAGSIGVHMYLFHRILSRNIFQVTSAPSNSSAVVNEKKLSSVLSRYKAKSQMRTDLETNPAAVPDPSK